MRLIKSEIWILYFFSDFQGVVSFFPSFFSPQLVLSLQKAAAATDACS